MNAVFVTQPLYSDPYKLLLWSTAPKRLFEEWLLHRTTFMLESGGFLAEDSLCFTEEEQSLYSGHKEVVAHPPCWT